MKLRGTAVLVAIASAVGLAAGDGGAQPAGHGGAQPAGHGGAPGAADPRMMSGLPRDDSALAAGVLTVRVVLGDLTANAAPGTPVQLVGVLASGAPSFVVRPLGADGRAEFTGLATDGSVTYYALALVGDDRLTTRPLAPGAKAGIRVLLAARRRDAQQVPIGPPIDDAAHASEPAPAAGEVLVRAPGTDGARVELVDSNAGAARPRTAKVAKGVARFSGVAVGGEHAYLVALAAKGGVRRLSRPFQLGAAGIVVHVGGAPLLQLSLAAQVDARGLSAQGDFTIVNPAAGPFDPGPGGLRLPFPEGATEVVLAEPDLAARVRLEGGAAIIAGPLAAGETSVVVDFRLPLAAGQLAFVLPPSLAGEASIAVEKTTGATLVPPDGVKVETRRAEGRAFFVFRASLAADAPLRFGATGVAAAAAAPHGAGGSPHGGAAGAPDPRAMSGIPRHDAEVDVGRLTVRVVHGDLGAPAAVDTPVHLVALRVGGRAELTTRPVGADGRAVFDDLAIDGSTAYYALALVGEDRLESQLVAPSGMAGARLMLAGRRRDVAGAPEGEAIDDAREEELEVPAGEVWLALGGELPKEMSPELVDLATGVVAKARLEPLPGMQAYIARFTAVTTPGPHLPRVTVGGRVYAAKPLLAVPTAGVARRLRIDLAPRVRLHLVAELQDEQMAFQLQWFVTNSSGFPWDTGKNGFFLPVPDGAARVGVPDELQSRVRLDSKKGVTWRNALPIGATEITVGLGLDVVDGEVAFDLLLPVRLDRSTLAVERAGDATMLAPGLAPTIREGDAGDPFYVMTTKDLAPGSRIGFTMSGLPRHAPWGRVLLGATAVAMLGAIALAVFFVMGRGSRTARGA